MVQTSKFLRATSIVVLERQTSAETYFLRGVQADKS